MAYVYQITNDINDKIYIGKTYSSIEKRFQQHIRDSKKQTLQIRPLYRAMRKYGVEHFHIELIEETDNPQEREIYWIAKKDSYHNGYNATLGGDGKKTLNYKEIAEVYLKLKNETETAKSLNISVDSVRMALRENNIQIFNPEPKIKIEVDMYDLQDNFICSFQSLTQAANYLIDKGLTKCKLSTIRTHISQVCRGKRKTAANFKWKSSQINEGYEEGFKIKPVICLQTKEVFASTGKAAKEKGLTDPNGITKVCTGKQKTAAGYTWMYLEDYNKQR